VRPVPPQRLNRLDTRSSGFFTDRSILDASSQHWACAVKTIMAARDAFRTHAMEGREKQENKFPKMAV
jgi:hypothetical protein